MRFSQGYKGGHGRFSQGYKPSGGHGIGPSGGHGIGCEQHLAEIPSRELSRPVTSRGIDGVPRGPQLALEGTEPWLSGKMIFAATTFRR